MRSRRFGCSGILALLVSFSAAAQDPAPSPVVPPNPGRELLLGKCAQCHTDSMWRDQRQDERAWEAALYRMVGRGAAWSGEEIKTMARYLATDFGPNSPRPPSVPR